MDLPTLASVLQLCLSSNVDERKAGEQRLSQFDHTPGHLVGLLQIVVRSDVDLAIRQVGGIHFKNLVRKDWKPKEKEGDLIPSSDKGAVRENIIEAIVASPPQIRVQLSECLKNIVQVDYPESWPTLLPTIDSYLKSQDPQKTYAALIALRVLSRKYEFKDEEDRGPMAVIVDTTFKILLDMLKHLLSLPNPSVDIAELIKLICKTFWSTTYLDIPDSIREESVCLEWMTCFLSLLERPVPVENQPLDPDLRKSWGWWKVKKWVLHIVNRLYNRFGDSKTAKGKEKQFALMFEHHCTEKFLSAYLKLLSTLRTGGYLPDRITNLALQYLTICIPKKSTYKLLQPHLHALLFEIMFPLMCFNDEDEKLWKEDPHEYIRKGYDIIEGMYSSRSACITFISDLVAKRGKENLLPYLSSILEICTRYNETPMEQRQFRQKDGALQAVGALSEKLKKTDPFKDQLEVLLVQHVYSEFQSPVPFLRARAAWLSGLFADIPFHDSKNFTNAMLCIISLLKDPELPVRVDAVVTLRSFFDVIQDDQLDELRKVLPQLLEEFCKLINEVENEDLVYSLETLVDKFGDEMAPYAVGLIESLATAFWKCIHASENADDDDDAGALAASGCLRAMATILGSISSLPEQFPRLEVTIFPILQKMLTTDGQDLFEELLEILSYMTYYSPSISPQMWTLWPQLTSSIDEWAIDFFEDFLGPLDNFVSRGTEHFLTCPNPNYQQSLFDLLSKLLLDNKIDDEDLLTAPKLMEVVFQNCKGRVDHWIEPYLQVSITRLRSCNKLFLKDLLMEVVANCLLYNPSLCLNTLQKMNCLVDVFGLWFKMINEAKKSGKHKHFKRTHDKKICILGLTSILTLPMTSIPEPLHAGMADIFKANLFLLNAYKTQLEEMEKLRKEDEEDDYDEDDDDEHEEIEEEDDDEIISKLSSNKRPAGFREDEEEEDDDYDPYNDDDDFTEGDDEDYQSPIDEIDPFIFFVDSINALSSSNPALYQGLTQNLDFHHQALAHGVAKHAEERKVILEKEKLEKLAKANGQTS